MMIDVSSSSLTKQNVIGHASYINEMVDILEKYKCGKKIEEKDQYVLNDLAMTGYIRYGFEFDQTTFLVTRTAKITAIGEEIIANS